jgi:hypothetical protein
MGNQRKRKRYAVGARVRIKNPGINGVVVQVEDETGAMGEYSHLVETGKHKRREPGCNLELIPDMITNAHPLDSVLSRSIHVYGDNARVNMNSNDCSVNVAAGIDDEVFVRLLEKIEEIKDAASREKIANCVRDMEHARRDGGFLQAYQHFIAVAADHYSLIAPFLPALMKILSGS